MIPALARAAMLLRGLLNRRGSAVADGSRRGCLLSGCLLTAGCLGAGALVAVACCGAVIAALAGAGASASDVCASLCSITPIDCIDVHASQGFGNTPWEHPHTGIDIVCPAGTPVISVTGGVFHRRSGGSIACLFPKGARGGLGTFAEVDTDGVSFLYGHLATLVPADGSTVVPGAQLGTCLLYTSDAAAILRV